MRNKKRIVPRFYSWLIRSFALNRHLGDALGDLEEIYWQIHESDGEVAAKKWFRNQALKSIPHFISNIFYWGSVMLKNYLVVGLRNIRRQKGYFLINITGLSAGLSIFILALIYTAFDKSYDSFHKDIDEIYGLVRVNQNANNEADYNSIVPAPLLESIREEFSEIKDATRYYRTQKRTIKHDDNVFYENDIIFADKNFFDFFTFPLIRGNRATILDEPNTIVLSERLADKYFGTNDIIGERVIIDNSLDLKVVGVCADVPINSSIQIDAVVPIETSRVLYSYLDERNINLVQIFVKGSSQLIENNKERFDRLIDSYYGKTPETPAELFFMHFYDFHNKRDALRLDSYLYKYGPNEMVYWYLSMAILLLALVSINFINLSTSRYLTRVKEVGLRKVIGADRKQLIVQFIGESVLLSVLALPFAVIIFELIKNDFMNLLGFRMNLDLLSYPFDLGIVVFAAMTLGFISGIYPAFYLSRFQPKQLFQNTGSGVKSKSILRQSLVVAQFGITFLLIVFTDVIYNQYNEMQNINMGYDRTNIITLRLSTESRVKKELLKERLLQHPDITMVTAADYIPGMWGSKGMVKPEGFDELTPWTMKTYGVDYNFTELLDIKILEGRSLSESYKDENNFLINRLAQKQLGWDNPIGKELEVYEIKGKVVGVTEDYIFHDIHLPVTPAVMFLDQENSEYLMLKHRSNTTYEALLPAISLIWKDVVPELPYEISSLDYEFKDNYKFFESIYTISTVFSGLAGLFSLLGLVGLAYFSTSAKVKEIGIRKVLGASSAGILTRLLKDFLTLIILANVVSIPITVFLVDKFVKYVWVAIPVEVSSLVYVFTFIYTILCAFFAVLVQSLRAANANPVESLKYE